VTVESTAASSSARENRSGSGNIGTTYRAANLTEEAWVVCDFRLLNLKEKKHCSLPSACVKTPFMVRPGLPRMEENTEIDYLSVRPELHRRAPKGFHTV
jgi:hypothetical protein